MNKKSLKKLLSDLCTASGISGDESEIAQVACEKLKKYCPDAHIQNGNVIGSMGSSEPDAVHIMLDAHLDQIGLIVTEITDDGFVGVGNVGGLDRRWFPAQKVILHGKKKIPGIISTLPPHLNQGEEKVQKIEQVRIDTGYPAEELRNILSLGDSVTFTGITEELAGDRFASPCLDDRAGIASVLYALDELKKEEIPCKVSVLFSNREEVNGAGAKTGCYAINPDIALAVDVSFAGDGTQGTGKAGEGVMIGFSPSLSKKISRDLVCLAAEKNISCQIEVMHGRTGTNADDFSVCREGVKACTLSIPLFYMHTPVEVIDLNDIKYTGKLIAEYLRRGAEC
ncbi:MAG: M42 family peptidase [Oscillospiraceae bacterium]|nr:M42 family peptidase [Oscillospiraceae bacterium]